MGMHKHLKASFSASYKERSPGYRARLVAWKKAPAVQRVEKPANPARAHALGYRAKKEFIVARVRVKKGKRGRGMRMLGRKPGKRVKRRSLSFPLRELAERRAANQFLNMRAAGSYFVGEEGMNKYFEVILRNPFPGSVPRRPAKKTAGGPPPQK